MWATKIIHSVRYALGITDKEYYICDLISHSQNQDAFSDSGWCILSYASISKQLFIDVRSCKRMCEKLVSKGLLLLNGRKKRVTNKWLSAFETVVIDHQNENMTGGQMPPVSVVNDHQGRWSNATKNGGQMPPLNIKSKFKFNSNSYKEENLENEKNLDLKKPVTKSVTGKRDESPKKKVPGKKKGVKPAAAFLFDDTALTDFAYFAARFSDTDYQFADLEYYRSRLRTWGNDNKVRLSEDRWLETAKTFMRRDAEQGNLIKKPELNKSNNGKTGQIIDPIQAYRILNGDS